MSGLNQFDEVTAADVARIRDMCEADCQALDAWKPSDKKLDSLTFEAYLRSSGASETAVATATIWTRAMLGQEPKDISALYFLNYCTSGGGLLQMRSDRKGGGQHLRIRQGMQILANGLAASLPQNTVHLSTPVTSVSRQTGSNLIEVRANGKLFVAHKVISTVPSPVLKSIEFSPKLPPAKQLWIESTTYGYYTKAMMIFESPFWVKKGFCGLAQSFTGPAAVIRDTCSLADKKYIITCFMSGGPGRAWAKLSTPERERAILKQLGEFFGVQSTIAQEFIEMITYEWVRDEYAGWGCPCTSLPPGVLETLGPDVLREPCGDLHFAGTETAGEWKGYMEGALRSGVRAAEEVIKGLQLGRTARL
jgi:monoamine oxidase